MDSDVSQYAVEIDLDNPNTSHTQVVELVGASKRVLDIGCWTGDLGRVLVKRGCHVSGVEIDPVAAEKARDVLQEVVVADLNTRPPSTLFAPGSFDAVVLADVLEHLVDPVAVLADAARLLTPHGRVVVSIPNVTHGSVRLALLQGRWELTETGLLDATHIKFFSRSGLLELFADAGMVIDDLRGTLADPLGTEVQVDGDRLPPAVLEWVRHRPDALVYQFVASARVADDGEDVRAATRDLRLVPPVPEESVRIIDKHTAAHDADVAERHRLLTVRDHIIGLEASVATAQSKAARAEAALTRVVNRLTRKDERIKTLRERIDQLEQMLEVARGGVPRTSMGRLRRGHGKDA